jgi:hypothetical protein
MSTSAPFIMFCALRLASPGAVIIPEAACVMSLLSILRGVALNHPSQFLHLFLDLVTSTWLYSSCDGWRLWCVILCLFAAAYEWCISILPVTCTRTHNSNVFAL